MKSYKIAGSFRYPSNRLPLDETTNKESHLGNLGSFSLLTASTSNKKDNYSTFLIAENAEDVKALFKANSILQEGESCDLILLNSVNKAIISRNLNKNGHDAGVQIITSFFHKPTANRQ